MNGLVMIRCVFVGCGASRWAVESLPINQDKTWVETSVGWVCPAHVRQARATVEASGSAER